MNNNDNNEKKPASSAKKKYDFGGIEEYDLEQIESEVLNDTVYLDVFAGSDPAFKQDVTPLTSADVSSLLSMNTYRFQYDTEKFKDKNLSKGTKIGLMADEVERFFPECVTKDSEGYRYVNYSMLVAPLIETVRALELKVSALEKKISQK